jgi:hypothetical protein
MIQIILSLLMCLVACDCFADDVVYIDVDADGHQATTFIELSLLPEPSDVVLHLSLEDISQTIWISIDGYKAELIAEKEGK